MDRDNGRWVTAFLVGLGDCAFRAVEPRGTSSPPPVIHAKKLTLVRKEGLVPVGDRSIAGAHLVTWVDSAPEERLALSGLWNEIAIPALSVVKGGSNGPAR